CLVTANGQTAQREPWSREAEQPDIPKPKDVPRPWRELIGEYGPENETMYALENARHLSVIFTSGDAEKLDELKANAFKFSGGPHDGQLLTFERDSRGRVTSMIVGGTRYDRRQVGPAEGSGQLRVEPLRPVSELLKGALEAQPPKES